MNDLLTITHSPGEVHTIHLAGSLTVNTEADFLGAVHQLRDAGTNRLVVDMSGVEMITSAGLRALHAALLLFTPRAEVEAFQREHPGEQFKSGAFRLSGALPHVHSILNMAGFLHTIPIYPTLQQAVDSFRADS